jgi:hypothetical protein
VILRAEGVAPTQGYHSATFVALGSGEPDAAGFLSFELTAVPPVETAAVGPQRTRELSAAVFLPTGVARNIKGFRVSGIGGTQTLPMP